MEYDETLIATWNAVVRPPDEVWHLSDFAYRSTQKHAHRCFDRLNGRKRLIRGNHDALAARLPRSGLSDVILDRSPDLWVRGYV